MSKYYFSKNHCGAFRENYWYIITFVPSEEDTLQIHINAFECFQEISKIENLGVTFVIDNSKGKNILAINEQFVSAFDKIFEFKKYETKKETLTK